MHGHLRIVSSLNAWSLLIGWTVFAADSRAFSQEWPMFRGGQSQTGVASETRKIRPQPTQGLSPKSLPDAMDLLWKYKTDGPVLSSAVVSDGRVFIGSGNNHVHAIDFKTGNQLWTFPTQASVEAPPMVLGNTVYVGSTDSIFYAIAAAGGSLKWQFESNDKIVGSANWTTLDSGKSRIIIFGSYDGALYALDAETGEMKWRYESQNYINGSPAVVNHRILIGGCDAMIHCLSAGDGFAVSSFDTKAYIAASVVYDGTYAFVGNFANQFLCVDIPNQKLVWEYKDRNFPFFSSAAVNDDVVVFGSRDRRVHCVNRRTGAQIWTFRTQGNVDSSPVICGNEVVVGSEDGRLYRLQLQDGKEVLSYEIGSDIVGSPAVANGVIIVGAEDGGVYAFGKKEK
jgi:outer membrane protein assembly factor BamB